jgi:hypothetical protein
VRVEHQNQGQWIVSGLASKPLGSVSQFGLKTDSYGLVICASKSPRRFLDLCLKTKRATVYWSHHKTDERIKTVRGTHQDLAACFT